MTMELDGEPIPLGKYFILFPLQINTWYIEALINFKGMSYAESGYSLMLVWCYRTSFH